MFRILIVLFSAVIFNSCTSGKFTHRRYMNRRYVAHSQKSQKPQAQKIEEVIALTTDKVIKKEKFTPLTSALSLTEEIFSFNPLKKTINKSEKVTVFNTKTNSSSFTDKINTKNPESKKSGKGTYNIRSIIGLIAVYCGIVCIGIGAAILINIGFIPSFFIVSLVAVALGLTSFLSGWSNLKKYKKEKKGVTLTLAILAMVLGLVVVAFAFASPLLFLILQWLVAMFA